MCAYFYIGFVDFMLKNKSLTDFTNLFSPNNFRNNENIILNYFKIDINEIINNDLKSQE